MATDGGGPLRRRDAWGRIFPVATGCLCLGQAACASKELEKIDAALKAAAEAGVPAESPPITEAQTIRDEVEANNQASARAEETEREFQCRAEATDLEAAAPRGAVAREDNMHTRARQKRAARAAAKRKESEDAQPRADSEQLKSVERRLKELEKLQKPERAAPPPESVEERFAREQAAADKKRREAEAQAAAERQTLLDAEDARLAREVAEAARLTMVERATRERVEVELRRLEEIRAEADAADLARRLEAETAERERREIEERRVREEREAEKREQAAREARQEALLKELEERAARLRELEESAARAAEERKQEEVEAPPAVLAVLRKSALRDLGGEPVDEDDLDDNYDAIPGKPGIGASTSSVPKLELRTGNALMAARLTEIDERVARLAASEARLAVLEETVEKRLGEADAARAVNLAQVSERWTARDVEMNLLITSSVSEQISAREGELREGLKEALAEAREARRLSESTALVATMSPSSTRPTSPYGGGFSLTAMDAWVQYYDEEVESDYFYNTETGETSWTRPEGVTNIKRGDTLAEQPLFQDIDEPPVVAVGESPWLEYWDESAQARYWYNQVTQEASWVEPDPDSWKAPEAPVTEATEEGVVPPGPNWTAAIDDQTGKETWVNDATGEVLKAGAGGEADSQASTRKSGGSVRSRRRTAKS